MHQQEFAPLLFNVLFYSWTVTVTHFLVVLFPSVYCSRIREHLQHQEVEKPDYEKHFV